MEALKNLTFWNKAFKCVKKKETLGTIKKFFLWLFQSCLIRCWRIGLRREFSVYLPLEKDVGSEYEAAAAAVAKSLQSCPTVWPHRCSPPGSPVPGFSTQEHWSGLPFPSPMKESERWTWSCSVVSTVRDPMDCSLPGASVHGIFQARVLEWVAISFSEDPFLNWWQKINRFIKNLVQNGYLGFTWNT